MTTERLRPKAAIVGMACVFPGAPDLGRFRDNLVSGYDAIAELPKDRLDPGYYDPSSTEPDRLYARRGGFIGSSISFDAASHGIMPVAAKGAEPDQLLALDVAEKALADARVDLSRVDRGRVSVILGRGGYMGPGMARLDQRLRTAREVVESLRVLLPKVGEAELDAVRAELVSELGPFGPDTAIGLVPNLAASRIANRLDLLGSAYTVDGACASSLLAVDHAMSELALGRSDVVLAGGVHLCHDITFWSVFSQLGALSRTQQIRPLDAKADGLLIGEGVGMVVLKRLEDALRNRDRIYAIVRGVGVGSDGRGATLMQPRVEGQVQAVERAWAEAGIPRESLSLIEAHGTATPAGDRAEIETLTRCFGDRRRYPLAIGSVKSMIGHAMPAAGVAGLIKAALALHEGVLFPTLHCDEPRLELRAVGLRPLAQAEAWSGPRVAGVNAFGFGGINAHVVLEGPPKDGTAVTSIDIRLPEVRRREEDREAERARKSGRSLSSLVDRRALARRSAVAAEARLYAADDIPSLLRAIDHDDRVDPTALGRDGRGLGKCRLALLAPTRERLDRARELVERGKPLRAGRRDVWFAPEGLISAGARVAFLFPGVDGRFDVKVDDLADHMGLDVPSALEAPSDELTGIGKGIVSLGRFYVGIFEELGVTPDALAGHSIGEWSAMVAAKMVREQDADALITELKPEMLEVPGVVFAAAGTSAEIAKDAMEGLSRIALSHDNCPHQVILCGDEPAIDEAVARLLSRGVLCQKLSFRSGFHSPMFEPYVGPYKAVYDGLDLSPATVPLYSATTVEPYPTDPAAVRKLALRHLTHGVRFRELVLRMYEDGVRVFVELGGGKLTNFVSDTLSDREHVAYRVVEARRSAHEQLVRTALGLFVEGTTVKLDRLFERRERQRPGVIEVPLGVPSARVRTPLVLTGPSMTVVSEAADTFGAPHEEDPVLRELSLMMSEATDAGRRVTDAFVRAKRAALETQTGLPAPTTTPYRVTPERTIEREIAIDLESFPEAIDHCFYRQPVGGPISDRFPVIPMTASVAMMIELASELLPGRIPVGVERIRALRWLAIAPPARIVMRARFDGLDRVEVDIEGYSSQVVRFAARYPEPPPIEPFEMVQPVPAEVNAARLYSERWLFHGPAYQGIRDLGPLADNGIRGTIFGTRAKGSLLDNAGQLLGYWLMARMPRDRLAMPVRVDRMQFFMPEPPPGAPVECRVRVTDVGEAHLRADLELIAAGGLCARITGWEDHRFESDPRLWPVLQYPEENAYAEEIFEGCYRATETWRTSAARELIMRRYLGEDERAEYARTPPRDQRTFLLSRIVLKDAVRLSLWERGEGPLFPVEVGVQSMPGGRVELTGRFGELFADVACRSGLAVAALRMEGPVGVALMPIDDGEADHEAARLVTPNELARLPPAHRDRAEVASAKVAAARALGHEDPATLRVTSTRDERLVIGELTVSVVREADYHLALACS